MSRLGGPWWLDPRELRRILIGCQAGLEEPWPSGTKGSRCPWGHIQVKICVRGGTQLSR